MSAFTADRSVVTVADIANAVEELQWVDYTARPHQHPPQAAPARASAIPVVSAPPLGHLLVASEGRTVQEVPVRLGRLIIGRTRENDVVIDSRFISRHHCQVITTEHSCVIEDLNSTNGIYVKANRVRRHYLNDGDVVLVGKHELIYVDDRAARARAALSETVPKLHVPEGEAAEPAAAQPSAAAPVTETAAQEEEEEEADEDAAAP
jgi:pSer/pThr/pTyr-binding forkhead associated (FHA) protein